MVVTEAVILCGGLGTRLRSVTGDNYPKVLVNVDGQPFLKFLIWYLTQQGIKRIVLSIGYAADVIEDFCQSESFDCEVICVREKSPLGTGGAFKYCLKFIQGNSFFGLNGDCFCPVDYAGLQKDHLDFKRTATMTVCHVADSGDYGAVEFDQMGKITAYREKDKSVGEAYVNGGVYCLSKEAFHVMTEDVFSIEQDMFARLVDQNLGIFKTENGFMDIGTPERLDMAQDYIKKVKEYYAN